MKSWSKFSKVIKWESGEIGFWSQVIWLQSLTLHPEVKVYPLDSEAAELQSSTYSREPGLFHTPQAGPWRVPTSEVQPILALLEVKKDEISCIPQQFMRTATKQQVPWWA